MSSYTIQLDDDGNGNYGAVVHNTATTKPAGGTRLTIPWISNNNALQGPNNVVITAATNATPIVCTTAALTGANALTTGDVVTISGGLVLTAINGTFTVTVNSTTAFQLDNSVGNGTYTASSAVVKKLPRAKEVATAAQAAIRAVLNDRASGN